MEDLQNIPVLVVGGGISGITTAIEIAEVGKKVILIEKLPYIGGRVIKMNNYFPKFCPPACGLEINFKRIRQNKNISIFISTTLKDLRGEKGNFKATLVTSPQFISYSCTSCGNCAEVCPADRINEFNYKLDATKAAYLPHEMAYPLKYSIDISSCKGKSCGKCIEVCDYQAIDLTRKEETRVLNVSAVVVATGWEPYDYSLLENINANNHPDVISNVVFERILAPNGPTSGKLLRLSDFTKPKSVVFIQCAGSRDENHLPYCSAVCCSASIKQAITVAEEHPEINISIFYIDIRLAGRNEDLLRKAQSYKNIYIIKGKASKVIYKDDLNGFIVTAEDILNNRKIDTIADLIVLATGIKVDRSADKFIPDAFDPNFINQEKLKEGIYAVSCTKKPMDVSASVKDATGVALKAIQMLF